MNAISYWTYVVANDAIVIDSTFNIKTISILLTSGTGFITGERSAGGLDSVNLELTIGTPLTLGTGSINVISGLTISNSGGAIQVIGF